MPSLEAMLAAVIMVSLTLYALLGGADYGGGVWDLFAYGPRATKQRELIARAIGPVWEANHVWLILVVVLLLTAFPPAFALISVSLHVPIALLLIGIVLRGSAFTFRAYDSQEDRVQRFWGRMFAIPSLLAPLLLGVVVGAISAGTLVAYSDDAKDSYFFLWTTPFSFAVGLFAVALFALLAAVYLTLETNEADLRNDFRKRAMIAELTCGILAFSVFLLAENGAPEIRARLAGSWWTWPLQVATASFSVGTLWALWTGRFRLAHVCAGSQVTLILWGWGLAQYPFRVRPELTLTNSAGPESTMQLLLWTILAGTLLLLPSYGYLLYIFKGKSRQGTSH